MTGPRGSMVWAAAALRHLGMPRQEIRAVLGAEDPETIHRYLELHRERLDELIAERRRTLDALERSLTEAVLERHEHTISRSA